jgi:hypothetical protein
MKRFALTLLALGLVVSMGAPGAWALGPGGGDITGAVPNVYLTGNGVARLLPGANVAYLDAHDQSRTDVLAGHLSYLNLYDASTAKVSGGDVSYIYSRNNSTVNVNGGEISWLFAKDQSQVNVTGAPNLSWLILSEQGNVDLYVREFNYGGGQISGRWANRSPFHFWAFFDNDLSTPPVFTNIMPSGLQVHVVPEPGALALAVLLVGVAARGVRRLSAG